MKKYISIQTTIVISFIVFLSIMPACSSSSPNTGDEAAQAGLEALRKMAMASDFSFHGYDSADDIGHETIGEPIEVKTLDFEALLAGAAPNDTMIISDNEFVFPVLVNDKIIGCIQTRLIDGEWEFISTGSRELIRAYDDIVHEKSLEQKDCYLLDLKEADLYLLGYLDNGQNYLIPIFDSASSHLARGTVYVLSDIAQSIKSELISEQESYNNMVPPDSGDDESLDGLTLEEVFGMPSAGGQIMSVNGEASNNLDVALSAQQQDEWCWAATGMMTMLFAGGDASAITQCAEANNAFTQTTCCNDGSTSACNQPWYPLYENWGFTASSKFKSAGTCMSWSTFKASIDAGNPVAFLWKWNSGGGHYQVAKGYYEDLTTTPATMMVYVNNPWPPNTGATTSYTYGNWKGGTGYDHKQTGYYYNIKKN